MPVRGSPEAEVVASLKRHLTSTGLTSGLISSILVDADASYRGSRYAVELEPMACVPIDGFRPDVVCSIDGAAGSRIVGIEVKARLQDWPAGLAQARSYRAGVHQAYLALPGDLQDDHRLRDSALQDGIGLLLRKATQWTEALPAAEPRPSPSQLQMTSLALRGIPAARRLQLNHPLNYIVVPFLASNHPGRALDELLAEYWSDLGTDGTRRHAIEGARLLGLINREHHPTPLGATTTDLLAAIGFDPATRQSKRARLSDASPAVAAITRAVLLQQPAVRLVVETLGDLPGHSAPIARLVEQSIRREEALARSLFLADPARDISHKLEAEDYNPSTVFKFKQALWHAGLLSSKAEGTAGRAATLYAPERDAWRLEPHLISRRG
jgi:hypothetical protein